MAGPGNSINETTTGISGFTGTAFVGSPLTQYNLLVGSSTSSTIANIAPSATSGVPVISQGSSANPVFGTAVVAGGGTGIVTTTAYGLITGGTTATGAFQNAGTGTAGQLFVSGGNSALGTYKTLSVVSQVFTGNGTYTPTTGMIYCIIEVVGGGGGGGGSLVTTGFNVSAAGGGGGGGYARKVVSAATIGGSQTVTVGAAANGGSAGNNAGTAGNSSSVGSIVSATGGGGGAAGANTATPGGSNNTNGGAGGVGSSGDFNANGFPGDMGRGIGQSGLGVCWGGFGGSSIYGGGAKGVSSGFSAAVAGNNGTNYGGGGGGSTCGNNTTSAAGGNGAQGIVIITEYVLA